MDTLELLTIKARLNGIKTFEDLDIAFGDGFFVLQVAKFVASKIGNKWLESDKSKLFRQWQDQY